MIANPVYSGSESDGKLRPVTGAVYEETIANQSDIGNHNPRVGGSSPSSATIETQENNDFDDGWKDVDWASLHPVVNYPYGKNDEGQYHYTEMTLERWDRYKGPAERCTTPEIMAGLVEFMDATDLPQALPLPPFGLPGHNGDVDREIFSIIQDGVRYLHALCSGERKTLWNIYNRTRERLRREYVKGREDGRLERVEVQIDSLNVAARERREAEAFVYFIESASGGIKIGMAVDVDKRLKGLQTAHPAKLTVLATTTGGQQAEADYHRRFAAHRLHGEWFAPHPDILAEIERLKEPTHA